MRIALRTLLLLLVFGGVGWFTATRVRAHAVPGTPAAEVRLASAMAGLFAGGAAAVVAGIALLWKRDGQA
jgi:hypothetical protein